MRNYWNKFIRFIQLSLRDFVDIDIEFERNDPRQQVELVTNVTISQSCLFKVVYVVSGMV